ncbi:MAG: aminotransferase class V-fold PLP-dependent enzyme [Cyclobacteriaceae bacterium]|nr:aminotransferase class V-fold PLP-dependent enzyme [Cyclobacteriaceae bacterium]MDH5251211.1 aminotransferase class V-fold PLP-dependent enzyme [Cyclobacteriaceae bacterium]
MQFNTSTFVPTESSEYYFLDIATKIIGHDYTFEGLSGRKKLLYADWIASGRLYAPIEELLSNHFGPLVGNTHSESSHSGEVMTLAYKMAQQIIKKHVNANDQDVIITQGSGMTGAIAKLQRMLGLRIPEKAKPLYSQPASDRPVVFLTHMEHHSNQTSWLECEVDVVVIPPGENLLVEPKNLERELIKYRDRKYKIGSFTACSNVTGIFTPYHKLAEIMHEHGGLCFVDFAASAPYANMNMHPENGEEALDAIFFSPHKFLGGPGSAGVLIFNKKLYGNRIPDIPGGGTVSWTNPWGGHHYFDDIETREDGGTPAFMQTIRAALAVRLKEQISVERIKCREAELLDIAFSRLSAVPGLNILAPNNKERLGVISFYVENLHYNFIVRVLSDHFGIQVRGGCSCAGTYGHYLLEVDQEYSNKITNKIDTGDLSEKPGWVRLSLHPVMTRNEVHFIIDAIEQIASHPERWMDQYRYSSHTNEYRPVQENQALRSLLNKWFKLDIS